jgi:hypothetical protein
MTATTPPTIDDIIIRMNEARAALEAVFTRVDDTLLAAASTPTQWAIKDHLAHLAAWAEGMAALLRGEPRWEAMGLTLEFVQTHDVDAVNARLFDLHEARSLAEVRAMFAAAHHSVIAALAALTDADLLRTYDTFQTDNPYDDNIRPIWYWIEDNTYGHYTEHIPWIQAWLAQHGEG